MILEIEFIDRQGDVMAIAHGENDVYGVGTAAHRQEAAVKAVNSYFRIDRALAHERDNPLPLVQPPTAQEAFDIPMVARSLSSVEDLLDASCQSFPRAALIMRYTDASENVTERRIVPTRRDGSLLTAFDIEKGAARTFRTDRIKALEPA